MVTWPWTNYYIALCLIHYGCVYCTHKLPFIPANQGLTWPAYYTLQCAKNMTDLADFTNWWNCSSSTQFAGVPSSLLPWFNRSFFCSCVVSWQHTTFSSSFNTVGWVTANKTCAIHTQEPVKEDNQLTSKMVVRMEKDSGVLYSFNWKWCR